MSDFRPRDIAAGGKGAPLVPYVDYLLFRHASRGRVALNIGGIANLTAIPPAANAGQVIAFDTGPGNMVIDALVARHSRGRKTFDRAGALASQGVPDPRTGEAPVAGVSFPSALLPRQLAANNTVLICATRFLESGDAIRRRHRDGHAVHRRLHSRRYPPVRSTQNARRRSDRFRRWRPQHLIAHPPGRASSRRGHRSVVGLRCGRRRQRSHRLCGAGLRVGPRQGGQPALGHGSRARGGAGEDLNDSSPILKTLSRCTCPLPTFRIRYKVAWAPLPCSG